MGNAKRTSRYTKFLVYVVAVILINLVGTTLFFRFDLTRQKKYSLSEASKQVLSTLSEPLTIKVFFTDNLSAPYNGTAQYLRDLLEEYALYADKHFNYQFYDVTPPDGEEDPEVIKNQDLARDYGIYPVQVQGIDADEIKFKQAYMGLVIIHGDLMEQIDPIDSTAGIEYRITTGIRKLTDKISTFMSLEDKIRVKLVLSPALFDVAPYMKLTDLKSLPETVRQAVDKLNQTLFGQLAFEYADAPNSSSDESSLMPDATNIVRLQWPDIPGQQGREAIPAGGGVAGIILEYEGKTDSMPALHVVDLPFFGTQYSLLKPEEIKETLNKKVEALVGINDDLGYLSSHGTLEMAPPSMFGQQAAGDSVMNFHMQTSKSYSLNTIMLEDAADLNDSGNCLIIARPTEPFSDYELFLIDQYLMAGNNLALFLDQFKETYPGGQPSPYAQPTYTPLDTGLEKLLAHYGVTLEKSIVMDESCYKRRLNSRMGGGEQPIYFAPIIKNAFINNQPEFMQNIKGLITMAASPITLQKDALDANGLTATTLFSSSDKSWTQEGQISLNPMFIQPPGPTEERHSLPLACLIEGEFLSYFAGRDIPVKPKEDADKVNEEDLDGDRDKEKTAGQVEAQDRIVTKGKPAKIFVTGASQLLCDNMFDENGRGPNSVFVMNLLDHLNGRDDIAVLRSKQQAYNPLADIDAPTRAAIKWFNIAGLPILVALFGLVVLAFRINKKRRLRMMFLQ